MLAMLRSGNAAQVKQAEEYFVNTTENFGNKAVRKMTRTDTGVTVIYKNGDSQTFDFEEGGKEKTNKEWLRSTSSGIGSTDDYQSVVSGGSSYNNQGVNVLGSYDATGELIKGKEGVVQHSIKSPESAKSLVRGGMQEFGKKKLETGSGLTYTKFAKSIGLNLLKKDGKYLIVQDGVEVMTDIADDNAAINAALRGVILTDDMLIESAMGELQSLGINAGGSGYMARFK